MLIKMIIATQIFAVCKRTIADTKKIFNNKQINPPPSLPKPIVLFKLEIPLIHLVLNLSVHFYCLNFFVFLFVCSQKGIK